MRKLVWITGIAVLTLLAYVLAADVELTVVVNDKPIATKGILREKRALVPIIEAAKAAGASEAEVMKDVQPVRIKVCIGSRCVIFKAGEGEKEALKINDKYYANYDFFAKALGGTGKYDAEAKKITLTIKKEE